MRGGGEIILKRITRSRGYVYPHGYVDFLLEIDGKLYNCRILEKNARNYINYFLYNKTNDKYYDRTLFFYILSGSDGISMDLRKNDVIVIRMNKNGSIRQLFESVYNNELDKIQINEISRINNKKQEEWNREWKTESTTSTDGKQSMKSRMAIRQMIGNFYKTGQAI